MQKPTKKRNVVAVLAGVAVATAVAASAASLGGITTQWLGANSNVVQAPVTDGLTVSWETRYDSANQYYVVSGFTLTPTTGTLPVGAEVALTLTGANSLSEELTGTVVEGGTVDLDGSLPTIAAHAVEGVSVVIVGGGAVAGDPELG